MAMSNLALFQDKFQAPDATYGQIARALNVTVEDAMCARGDWLAELLERCEAYSLDSLMWRPYGQHRY
jgi:hypothetical protein